ARQPVSAVQSFLRLLPSFRRKNSHLASKFRADDFASHRAGSNFYVRVIADALGLARIDSGSDNKFAVQLGEPHRGIDRDPAFAERNQANIFLTLNLVRNRHSPSPPFIARLLKL